MGGRMRASRKVSSIFVVAAASACGLCRSANAGTFQPVSWQLHATATASQTGYPTVTNTPPDLFYGAEFGSHGHSASASTGQMSGSANVGGTLDSSVWHSV